LKDYLFLPKKRANFAPPKKSGIYKMANHKSALKRIRANEAKRLRNRYQHKTTRTMIKRLRATDDKAQASDLYKTVSSMLDKLARKNVIHKNKANNQKSRLAKFINRLSA
jgi:small subunit ribosomal protein S20